MKRVIIMVLAIMTLVLCTCACSSDGGNCVVCGSPTNWTYKGGAYFCYSCDKGL